MSQQMEATKEAAEKARQEMRADFVQQIDALTARLDSTQQANDRYQAALQAALEERLAEFANHQHQTLTTINSKLAGLPSLVQAELPAQFAVVSQGLRDYLEHKTRAVETQIDELHKHSRRFDEQSASIVAHINETIAALTRRMDDGDLSVTRNVEQRLGDVRGLVDQAGADVARQLAEHGQILSQRVDAIDMKMVDRAMAMEERINEHNGTKIAGLEALRQFELIRLVPRSRRRRPLVQEVRPVHHRGSHSEVVQVQPIVHQKGRLPLPEKFIPRRFVSNTVYERYVSHERPSSTFQRSAPAVVRGGVGDCRSTVR